VKLEQERRATVQKKIDSLELILPSSTGSKRLEVLNELSYACMDFDNQKSLSYAQEADSLVRSIGDSTSIKRFDWLYSQILRKTGNNSKAIETAKEALVIAKRDGLDEDEKKIYNILALAYIANAEYDEALSILFEGLIIFEKDKNDQEISIVLNSIGAVFFRIENYQKALNYFQESLSLSRAISYTSEIDRLLINMAQCQAALNNFAGAIKLANEGLTACNNHCSEAIKSEGNFSLGLAFFGLNKIPEALAHFERAYTFSRNSGDNHFRAESLIYLAKIFALSNNRQQAIVHLVEAEEAAANNYAPLLDVYKEFINVYKGKEKELDRLIHYQRLFIDLKERIYTSELTDNLARVEADYKERWNTAMISHQQKVITLNEELIQKQNIATIAIVVIIILFLAFIVILYRNNQFKKQIGIRLEMRVRERSDELNESILNLEKTYTVQESKIAQMNAAILQYAAELETLCNETLQNKELDPSQQEYMTKMNETLAALREYVSRNK
jgi:tetratricopeptide (TPR) repeat protein